MKKIQYLLPAIISTALFIIWTILVKTVDVQYISNIGFLGFYNLNISVNEKIQAMNVGLFDNVSDVLLFISLATIIPFAVVGVVQLIKNKSLKKVDPVLYIMLLGYVLMLAGYFIFEIMNVNASPVSTPEKIKPSYPSSHVLAFLSLSFIALTGLFHFVDLEKQFKIVFIVCFALADVCMVVTRLLSGQHYLTDIIGGILLSASVITIVYGVYKLLNVENAREISKENENA